MSQETGERCIIGFEHIFGKCMTTECRLFWTLDLSLKIQIKGMPLRDVLPSFSGQSPKIFRVCDYVSEVHLLHRNPVRRPTTSIV